MVWLLRFFGVGLEHCAHAVSALSPHATESDVFFPSVLTSAAVLSDAAFHVNCTSQTKLLTPVSVRTSGSSTSGVVPRRGSPCHDGLLDGLCLLCMCVFVHVPVLAFAGTWMSGLSCAYTQLSSTRTFQPVKSAVRYTDGGNEQILLCGR